MNRWSTSKPEAASVAKLIGCVFRDAQAASRSLSCSGRCGPELEASSRIVREGMIEDLERRLMLVEEELEVVVARSIADGDSHQIRRPTPKQSHCDAVALARHQFRPPGFVCLLKHVAVPSLGVVTRNEACAVAPGFASRPALLLPPG
jgi:hypothetical protein